MKTMGFAHSPADRHEASNATEDDPAMYLPSWTWFHKSLCLLLVVIGFLPSSYGQAPNPAPAPAKPPAAPGGSPAAGGGGGSPAAGGGGGLPPAAAEGIRIEKDSLIERYMVTLKGYVEDAKETLVMAVRAAPETAAAYKSQLQLWQDTIGKMKLNTEGQTLQSLRAQLETMYSTFNSVIIPLGMMSLQPDVTKDGHFAMALSHFTSSVNNLKVELEKLWRSLVALMSSMNLMY